MRLVVTPLMRQLLRDAEHPDIDPGITTISWRDLTAAYEQSDYAARNVSLRSLCLGSEVVFERIDYAPMASSNNLKSSRGDRIRRNTASEKSPELASLLEELQRRLEQRRYDDMVRDVTARERLAEAAKDTSLSAYKEQLRFGAHVISMMAVFSLLGYFASFRLFPQADRVAARLLCGVVGMFTAMVVETVLFVIRDGSRGTGVETRRNQTSTETKTTSSAKPHVE